MVRIQPDTFSSTSNFLDLEPVYRDKSGLGMPVIRITYDMRENEHKLANWMEAKAEEILRVMGSAAAAGTKDGREGLAAFREKRSPKFTGN